MYQLKLMYKDDKDLAVPIEDEKLGEFYTALANRQIFWFEPGKSGFWTDFSDIRYVQVFLQQQDGSLTEVAKSDKIEELQPEVVEEDSKDDAE